MYRVTPIFEGDNLLCKGVKMEAYSVEDDGKGISFNVFCYNTQPSIKIDYKTGEMYLTDGTYTIHRAEAIITAEDYYNKCLALPMFPSLTDEEQDWVIEKVLEFVTCQ